MDKMKYIASLVLIFVLSLPGKSYFILFYFISLLLTFNTLEIAVSVADKLNRYLFAQKMGSDISYKLSPDNMYEMSKYFASKN